MQIAVVILGYNYNHKNDINKYFFFENRQK